MGPDLWRILVHLHSLVRIYSPLERVFISWTILYDTIYACQDRKDDVQAGVKSTALLFGDWVKQILAMFAVAFVATLAYAGYQTNQSWIYFTISVGGCAAHLFWQLVTLDPDVPEDCWAKFDVRCVSQI